ncbi:hypothetical protein [Pseudarthrobacter equi]|uniref:hypothetical protein n=1 Tax=Pseudarthrobacter equi TaxID=728066 RepID=UPI0028D417AC|nr:hypothetical protein [Pseudarthrobacter equi]
MSERADFEATPAGDATGHGPGAPQYGQRTSEPWTPPESAYEFALPAPSAREDVVRGTVYALAAAPVGIIAWMVLWNMGWMASIVAFVAAALAARLYVLGTGGPISRRGAWVVAAVTLVTVLLSFWGGMLLDAAKYLGGGSPLAMLVDPGTWDFLMFNVTTNRELIDAYAGDFLVALLFSALGCFFTLRRLFAQTKGS